MSSNSRSLLSGLKSSSNGPVMENDTLFLACSRRNSYSGERCEVKTSASFPTTFHLFFYLVRTAPHCLNAWSRLPYSRPKISYIYTLSQVNCLKTIPFTATHAYIAQVWQYTPPGKHGPIQDYTSPDPTTMLNLLPNLRCVQTFHCFAYNVSHFLLIKKKGIKGLQY